MQRVTTALASALAATVSVCSSVWGAAAEGKSVVSSKSALVELAWSQSSPIQFPTEFWTGSDIQVGTDGQAYVLGFTYSLPIDRSFIRLTKYRWGGERAWVATYDGGAGGVSDAAALALDAKGNAFVTGSCFGEETGSDIVTLKYDETGQLVWAARVDGTTHGRDRAKKLVLDPQGNVLVAGATSGEAPPSTFTLLKYDPDGQELWRRRDGLDNAYGGGPEAMAVDSVGACVVALTLGLGNNKTGIATVKYDKEGNRIWMSRSNGGGNSQSVSSLALDSLGNVIIAGYTANPGSGRDYLVVKYAPDGSQAWMRTYDSPRSSINPNDDYASAVGADFSGNVYVTGFTKYPAPPGSAYSAATVKYDGQGRLTWVRHVAEFKADALKVDAAGEVYVAGYVPGTNQVLNYSPEGTVRWTASYAIAEPWPPPPPALPVFLTIDQDSSLYLAGTTDNKFGGRNLVTTKYIQTVLDYTPGEAFRLQTITEPGQVLRVERTSDFLAWDELGTVKADGVGAFRFEDATVVTWPQNFYRFLPPP